MERFENYHLKALISRGSMGEIWRARHLETGRFCAIKIVTPALAQSKWIVQSLKNEWAVGKHLKHPNLLRFERWVHDGDAYGIVMELVKGDELKVVQAKRTLSDFERLEIAKGLCDAVQAFHDSDQRNYVLHLDIKPENVLIREGSDRITRDRVVLVDYGTARLVPRQGSFLRVNTQVIREFISRQKVVGGSFLYMSPEQTKADHLDVRSDVYSIGCVLYELWSGEPPFDADSSIQLSDEVEQSNNPNYVEALTLYRQTLAMMHQHKAPRPLREFQPTMSAVVEKIILKCLQKKPGKRFQTVFDLNRALANNVRDGNAELTSFSTHPTGLDKDDPSNKDHWIVCVKGPLKQKKRCVTSRVLVGRQVKGKNDFAIDDNDMVVSSRHAEFKMVGKMCMVADLGSTNGVFVNGRQVRRKQLNPGDRIRIGHYEFELVVS